MDVVPIHFLGVYLQLYSQKGGTHIFGMHLYISGSSIKFEKGQTAKLGIGLKIGMLLYFRSTPE